LAVKEKRLVAALISLLFTAQMNDEWQEHAAEEDRYPYSFGRFNSPVPPFFR
jgi:hypothetical protein